jgi:hypothetical protein
MHFIFSKYADRFRNPEKVLETDFNLLENLFEANSVPYQYISTPVPF